MSLEIEPKHKKLTRFLCQELLYEYVSGSLDRARANDVEQYLPTCRDSQRELENLMKGLAYTKDVASIQVSPSLRAALQAFEPAWKKRVRAWKLWSSQRGWRMLPYAFLLSAATLGLYVTKPWQKDMRKDVVLVEQTRAEPPVGNVSSPQLALAANVTGPEKKVSLLVQSGVMATTPPSPQPEPEAPKEPAKGLTKAEEVSADEERRETGTGKGSLLRGQLEVAGFDAAWPAIRDKIISLEGKAAGTVELGWLRKPDESYFHFSLPESNYAELETFLKSFGPVRINKERHPRVMPAGQIRIILTVKDGGKNEGEAEAP